MKIKSIQFGNFGCYKGIHDPILFSTDSQKNVTVILGANKSGKTTLVQAFLWCLYGSYAQRDTVINSEVKHEMQLSSFREVFVEIVLVHAGREYAIRRSQRFSKSNERVRGADISLKVNYKEVNGEQQAIDLADCQDTVNNILPQELSDYFFYEGERFVDISKKDVATAVKGALNPKTLGGALNWAGVALDTGMGIYDNIQAGTRTQKIVSDAVVDAGIGVGTIWASTAAGAALGSIVPGPGNVVGAVGGFVVGGIIYLATDVIQINGKSASDWMKEGAGWVADKVVEGASWVGDKISDGWNSFTSWLGF